MQRTNSSSRQRWARCMYAVALTALLFMCGDASLHARTEAAQLTPRVDTLWTLPAVRLNYMAGFYACALGGNPQALIVAGPKLTSTLPINHVLLVIDPMTGDTIRSVLSGHTSDETDMHFAARANIFGTADYGTIKLWRWPELELLREFRTPSDYQNRFLITADGRRLFSNIDGVMYDTQTGDTLWRIQLSEWSVGSDVRPAMTADDSLLVTVRTVKDRGQLALVVRVATGEIIDQLPGGDGASWIAAVDISEDGRYVAVARTATRETGQSMPGSCVVYDRLMSSLIVHSLRLDGEDMEESGIIRFSPGGTGIHIQRLSNSVPQGTYFYPLRSSEPTVRWGYYFSGRTNTDGTIHYDCRSGVMWLGPMNWSTVSVSSTNDNDDLDVVPYPNPVDGTLTLTGLACSDGTAHAEVIDMTGRRLLVTSADVSVGTCRLDVSSVPAGTHLLRLQRNDNTLFVSTIMKR
jgi:hypothetical protein